jgi:hypothetical protein
MSFIGEDGYCNVMNENPKKFNDYLVKTEEGTYEFAHFNCDGWTILGDNKGATVRLWIPIPTTDQ